MARFQHSGKTERILSNKTVIVIGLIILVFLSIALGKELLRRYEISREIEQLETEIADLEQRNLDLDDLIDYFNTNSFVEKEARTKLGLQKAGETMVIFPETEGGTESAETAEAAADEAMTNLQRWWKYFFKFE
ncbi:MAG: septum formation initiator family protein [Patescibacteria group bacterium]